VRTQAPAAAAWAAVTDWERQGQWMPGTRVRATTQGGRGVGGGIEAWTGIGPLGFLDTMVITVWEPPHRCVVRHTGRLVRGGGAFEVADAPDGASTLTWIEELDLPGGALGRFGWRLIEPVVRHAVARALGKLAASIAAAA
jgi:carbon monoxide dehydrogenase subunit G